MASSTITDLLEVFHELAKYQLNAGTIRSRTLYSRARLSRLRHDLHQHATLEYKPRTHNETTNLLLGYAGTVQAGEVMAQRQADEIIDVGAKLNYTQQ